MHRVMSHLRLQTHRGVRGALDAESADLCTDSDTTLAVESPERSASPEEAEEEFIDCDVSCDRSSAVSAVRSTQGQAWGRFAHTVLWVFIFKMPVKYDFEVLMIISRKHSQFCFHIIKRTYNGINTSTDKICMHKNCVEK